MVSTLTKTTIKFLANDFEATKTPLFIANTNHPLLLSYHTVLLHSENRRGELP